LLLEVETLIDVDKLPKPEEMGECPLSFKN